MMRFTTFLATFAALFCLVATTPDPLQAKCSTKALSTLHKPTTSTKAKTSTKSTTSFKTSTLKKTTSTKISTSSKKSTLSTKTSSSVIKSTKSSSKISSTSSKALSTSSVLATSSRGSTSKSTEGSSTPVISIPSVSIPSISIPTISVSTDPLTTTISIPNGPPTTGCTPATGDAIVNGGFGDGDAPFEATTTGDTNTYGAGSSVGIDGQDDSYGFQFQSGGAAGTFTLSQTTCLVVGAAYTYTFYVGLEATDTLGSTGCNVGFISSDGQTLVPEVPVCGGQAMSPDDYGTCTVIGYDEDIRFQRFSGTYVPTTDQITFSVTGTCGASPFGEPLLGVIDMISVVPA